MHTVNLNQSKAWTGTGMLLAASLLDARKNADPQSKMTARDMALASMMVDAEDLAAMRQLGFTLFQTDLDQMGTNELLPDKWNWDAPDAYLQTCKAAKGKWSLAVHFHVPPQWFREKDEFVPLRCSEHGASFPGWSIWHRGAVEFQRRGYKALRKQYGDDIQAIWVGVNGDYGENEFPTGYRLYHKCEAKEWSERFGDAHTHPGWWCQDNYAQADFRKEMIGKYGTLAKLNLAWNSDIETEQEITYPGSAGAHKRRWLDFVQWYSDSMTRFSSAVASVAKEQFPSARIFWLLGGPDEDPRMGQDQSGLVKAASKLGIEIRSSHGGCLGFARNYATMHRRIAGACKFYRVPFWSEPPYTIDAETAVGRFFEAVSCGAVAFYDWAWNILEQSVLEKYQAHKAYLTQEKPVVDVALFFPTSHHLLSSYSVRSYPPRFEEGATALREVFDYDILDERMILDGALEQYRLLIFLEGSTIEASTLEAVTSWIRKGGVAATYDLGLVETIEPDTDKWSGIFGFEGQLSSSSETFSVTDDSRSFLRHLAEQESISTDRICSGVSPSARVLAGTRDQAYIWANPLGSGWAVMFAGSWQHRSSYYELLRDLVYNLSALDTNKQDALSIDDKWNGVYSTVFEGGKILFYNPHRQRKTITVFGNKITLEPVSLAHAYYSVASSNVIPLGTRK